MLTEPELTSSLERVQSVAQRIQKELEKVVFGQTESVQNLMVALISRGHVLLEGVPGLAKTLLVRSLGQVLNCKFSRIQFTPDLMPADVTGLSIFDSRKEEFVFRQGPLFADLVLADEINRTPAKTQAALLEAMQEGQVSVDGQTHPLSRVFMVVATQNPVESEGTYPLPEAQLDRFLLKLKLTYPDQEHEKTMLATMHELGSGAQHPEKKLEPVASIEDILSFQAQSHLVRVDETVIDYILNLVRGSRSLSQLELGCSPRSALMLLQATKALAILRGRSFVSPDEVQSMFIPVMRHRVLLTPEAEIEGFDADRCLENLISKTTVPR